MTVPQSHKSARRARWLSTGHGKARPDFRLPSQIVAQPIEFDAFRRAFISGSAIAQLVATAPSKSASPPAALKDAMRRTKSRRGLFAHSFVHHHVKETRKWIMQ